MDKKTMPDIDLTQKIKTFEAFNNLCKKEVKILNKMYEKYSKMRDIDLEMELKMVQIQKQIHVLETEIENKQKFINRFYTHGVGKQ